MRIVRVTVRVKPGASRARVGGAYGEPSALIVAVHAQPVDGAANSAVISALSAALAVRKADISVVAGHTGRTKIIAIQTTDERDIQQRIAELLAS